MSNPNDVRDHVLHALFAPAPLPRYTTGMDTALFVPIAELPAQWGDKNLAFLESVCTRASACPRPRPLLRSEA